MRLSTLVPLLGLLALGTATKCPKQKTSPGREILCYTSTYDVQQLNDSICRCTTLVHQGHNLHNFSTSGIDELQKSLKEQNSVLQFVISVSDAQGSLKTSATTRQEAAARLVRLLAEVDGVELDLTAGSKERLTHFVKGLKDEMVRKSNEKRILLALPSNAEDLAKQFELKALTKYVDLFTIATHYLFNEGEAYNTFHPSRLMGLFDMLNTDSLVDLISGLGAPKRRLLVSLPASAYKFTLKDKKENTPRSPTKEESPVVLSRKELCELMSEGEWTVERDEDLTAPYAFKDDTWIAFEDKTSAGIKGKYTLLRELAGLGIRNVEHDSKNDCGKPITHEVYHSFTDMKRKTRGAVLSSLEDDLHHANIAYPTRVKSSGFRIVRVVDTAGHIHAIRENTQTEFSCTRQGYFVHPKSCNRFYRCVKFNQGVDDYSVFEFDCPAGLAFDERTEVCVWPGSLPEGSPCPGSSEIAPVPQARFECPQHPGYYADPQNCRWFFACFDLGGPELTAYEFRCPFGLVFDEKRLICEWPWLVPGCGVSGYSRTEYGGGYGIGSGGHGIGSGIGYGGSDGKFSGSDGSGYTGGAGGVGYSGAGGAGHIGAGGSGYAGGAGSGVGGYAGSAGTGHAGASGAGYAGGAGGAGAGAGHFGAGGSGYAGGAGSGVGGYAGSAGTGHAGAGGAGYAGGAGGAGAGAGHFGAGGSGYSGGAGGSGYSGGAGGSGYSGGAGGVGIGAGHFGAGGSGYSGSAGGSGAGGAGAEHLGAGGFGYSGSAGGPGIGSAGAGHFGVGGSGHFGKTGGSDAAHFGAGDSGYSSSASGSGTGGVGAGHFGVGGSGYSGGAGLVGGGVDGHFGGSAHAGDASGAGIGGSGYAGNAGEGAGHFGAGGSGYTGGTSTVGSGHFGTGNSGYTEGTSGGYAGSAGAGHLGTGSSAFGSGSSSAGAGFGIKGGSTGSAGGYAGSSTTGYSGSRGSGHGGSTGGYTISTDAGSGYTGHGATDTGGYSEATGAGHFGSIGSGAGYSGATGSGHSLSTVIDHTNAGFTHGSGGSKGYSSTTGAGHSGLFGAGGTEYLTNAGSFGSSGTKSSGAGGSGYTVTTGVEHAGGAGYSGVGTTVGGFGGSTGTVHLGSSGLGYTDGAGSKYTGSIGSGYHSSTGHPTGSGVTLVGSGIHTTDGQYIDTSSGVGTKTHYGTSTNGKGVLHSGTVSYHGNADSDGGFVINGGAGHGLDFSTGKVGTSGSYYGTTGSTGGYVVGGAANGLGLTAAPGDSSIGTTYYGSGGKSGTYYAGGGATSSFSNDGKGSVSSATTTYHGKSGTSNVYTSSKGSTGSVTSGNAIHGSIATGDSTSGTVLTHGDGSGAILTGNVDQGSIVVGVSQPGYVKTETGSPGYVVGGGVKTIYEGSASPGTLIHGTAAPGVIVHGVSSPGVVLKGDSSPGVLLTGQTAPGVLLGGSVHQGSTIVDSGAGQYVTGTGSTTYHGNTGSSGSGTVFLNGGVVGGGSGSHYSTSSGQGAGYKAEDGARGTTIYNNGYISTKYSEDDQRDYRPSYATLPDSIVSGGRAEGSGGVILGTTLAGVGDYTLKPAVGGQYTRGGFTKTGATNTGIRTAQLGGSGGYVTGTGRPRPRPNPENIGAKAFEGSVGYTSGPKLATDVNNLAHVSSTIAPNRNYATSTIAPDLQYVTGAPDVSHIDTSKLTFGSTTSGVSSGYSYSSPHVQFTSGGIGSSTPAPLPHSVTYQKVPVAVTTPSSLLNIEVYNTPSVVTSAPITAAPAVVNTYSSGKPASVQYKETLYQAAKLPTVSTSSSYSYKRPVTVQKQYTATPTATPVAYTIGPLESYRTTLFEAAKLPGVISTVQPVIDTGYKTIISPSVVPVTVSTDNYSYKDSRFQTGTLSSGRPSINVGAQQHSGQEYIAVTTPASVSAVSSGYTYTKPRKPFTYKSPTSTAAPSTVTYEQPAVAVQQQVHYESVSSPAPAVSYKKPFPPIHVTYKYPAVSTAVPVTVSEGYSYPKPAVPFVSTTPGSYSIVGQGLPSKSTVYFGSTLAPTTIGGSPANYNIPKGEVTKFTSNYERGNIRYTPNVYDVYSGTSGPKYESSGPAVSTGYSGRKQGVLTGQSYVSSTAGSYLSNAGGRGYSSNIGGQGYSSNTGGKTYVSSTPSSVSKTAYTPAVTTFSGNYFSKGYSSTPLYEVATIGPNVGSKSKGKVIVKLSDLHPLLLGKLGAQCTCKDDPTQLLRGPGRKSLPINSSNRGPVDLANYDESEVYVDLESDKDESGPGYTSNYGSSTPTTLISSPRKTPVISAVFGVNPGASSSSRYSLKGRPSSTYLPVSSTPSVIGIKDRTSSPSSSTYLPAHGGNSYPADSEGSDFGSVPAASNRHDATSNRNGLGGPGIKALKSPGGVDAAGHAIGGHGAAFDRYGPGGWRGLDETLQGSTDCARPGLFRHPKYCNKFYACHWDEWKQKFTLHVFNCPVHLSFDSSAGACNWPSKGPACMDDNLLV